jgi:hypothetical protein
MEHFGVLLSWFGPLEIKQGEGETTLLDRVYETLSQDWFHGDIEKPACEAALNNKPPGTYLVRVSNTVPGQPFTISKVSSNGQINHQRIEFNPQRGYRIVVQSRSGPHVLADNSTLKHFIEKIAPALSLVYPHGPNPYKAIIHPPEANLLGGYLMNQAEFSDSSSSDDDIGLDPAR